MFRKSLRWQGDRASFARLAHNRTCVHAIHSFPKQTKYYERPLACEAGHYVVAGIGSDGLYPRNMHRDMENRLPNCNIGPIESFAIPIKTDDVLGYADRSQATHLIWSRG